MWAFSEYAHGHLPVNGGVLAVSLPFNPLKLLLLIGWVYLCLYFVQRVQLSPLVPKHRKSMANIVTLFTGPLLLFVVLIVDSARTSSSSGRGILAILGEHIKKMLAGLRPSSLGGGRKDSKITLLDSSGRHIKEILGGGKSKGADRHVLELTEQIVFDALEGRASDILIDPKDEAIYTVRFRIDGVLRVVDELDMDMGLAVINSIKAVSGMDISERRRPQDGAFAAKIADATAGFRAASAGVLHGEKLSLRVLSTVAGQYTLTNIGMTEKQRAVILNSISKPSGMILLCGPTGSGKTTTLYAMLGEIDFYTRNVITVEDPIECVLPRTSQIEVNPKAGITFASSLRSILRQDPDVICVGEIRDEETAAIGLRAAQTGHLVMATVHCDTNASALIRLMDLGVTPLLMSSGLSVIAAQRLLRRLCDNCKMPAQLSPGQVLDFRKKGVNHQSIFQPRGCGECNGTGYRGRIGIFDILLLDDRLKASIANNQLSVTALREEGSKKGKASLFKHGLKMVVSGITSLEELKRVVG
ncbi:MAG: GspE/PulE family protein [Planctomycetota bacterium]